MSTHRFIVVAHTDPIPGDCHTPASLANAIKRTLDGMPYVDDVKFLVMDTPTDAADFHQYQDKCNGDCACGEGINHPVHDMPHRWGGVDGMCGSSPCIIPDCQGEKFDIIHNI